MKVWDCWTHVTNVTCVTCILISEKYGLKIPVTWVTYVTCSDKAGIFGPM